MVMWARGCPGAVFAVGFLVEADVIDSEHLLD
jgi:hypothetical protein